MNQFATHCKSMGRSTNEGKGPQRLGSTSRGQQSRGASSTGICDHEALGRDEMEDHTFGPNNTVVSDV